MKFEIGQLVKIVGSENPTGKDKFYGEITEITSEPFVAVNAGSGAIAEVYEVDLHCPSCSDHHRLAFRGEHLELIPGGDEPTTWDEGIFRPVETVKVTTT